MSASSNNDKRIRNAFARLQRVERTIIPRGLEAYLVQAVKYALQLHDAEHQRHIDMGDNYGWLIAHDGVEVRRFVKARGAGESGEANAGLDEILSEITKTGWVGVVMAGMHPFNYYAVDYETGILNSVIGLTPELFRKQFKKI